MTYFSFSVLLSVSAPKTVEAPQTPETCLDNGHLPEGIRICDTREGASSLPGQMVKFYLCSFFLPSLQTFAFRYCKHFSHVLRFFVLFVF